MQATPHRQITVSIVSHGQQALVLPLLEQLDRLCADWIDRLVLTVNVPEADLCRARPWRFALHVVQNTRPKGFGANHNAAFQHCASAWFLVLNPDIRIDDDVLGKLLQRERPRDGLLAPRIHEPGRAAPEPYRGLLTPREILTRNRSSYRPPTQPAWIPGMFMLLRSQAYRQVEGFDERFFMYGEDFDLCARLQLASWHLWITDDLQVQHEARRASRRDLRHLRWHFWSLLQVWGSSAFWRYRRLVIRRATLDPKTPG